jgi:hypothetical protein
MSLDMSTCQLIRRGRSAGIATNGTYELLMPEGTNTCRFGSPSFNWRVLGANVRIITAAASSISHTFKVQMDEDGTNDFTSPVTLCSIAISPSTSAGYFLSTRGATGSSVGDDYDVPPARLCRAVHTATNTDTQLIYEYEVFGTDPNN